jgi:hypothetical protein
MATAFVHVGQAGLQVAEPFWELASDHPSARSWLFDDSARAHCLLVDCEPRVVRSVARSLRRVVRDDAAHVLRAHGSANNWAMGFGSVSPDSLDAIADSMRRMVERMDWWSGTVITHSLAGGTGSGLGSRLLLDIRDAYPRQWLVSAAVLPFPTGDSALQNYNAALALAHVQQHADMALLFENQQLLGAHERQGRLAAGRAGAMASSPGRPRPARRHMPVGSWDALGLQLGEQFPRFYAGSERAVTLSALAIARGAAGAELRAPAAKLERVLSGSPLSPFNVEWRYAPSQNGGCGVEQSLSVIANRTSVEAVLSQTLNRADAQLDAGAYVHHYARYGCTEPVLREYVDECWGIVAEYRQAQSAAARSAPPAPRGASSVRSS